MLKTGKLLLGVGLGLAIALSAGAVEPAYDGPMGNPEEPALRPYKGMIKAAASFVLNVADAFVEGNTKVPVLGTVEVGRGVGRGTLEVVERVYTGMAGTMPENPRKLTRMNQFVNSDPFLTHARDFGGTVMVVGWWPIEARVEYAIPVYAALLVVDSAPIEKFDETVYAVKGRDHPSREAREGSRILLPEDREASIRPSRRSTEQAGGNFIKKSRRGELVRR